MTYGAHQRSILSPRHRENVTRTELHHVAHLALLARLAPGSGSAGPQATSLPPRMRSCTNTGVGRTRELMSATGDPAAARTRRMLKANRLWLLAGCHRPVCMHDSAFDPFQSRYSVRLPRHVWEPVPPTRLAVRSASDDPGHSSGATHLGLLIVVTSLIGSSPLMGSHWRPSWAVGWPLVTPRVLFKVVSIGIWRVLACGHS
jgi:hypothetical protein